MEKFINFQTTIFLFCLCLFLFGILSSCDSLSSLTDAEHVERAKDARDRGDLATSVIELKNALQKNPENPEARRLLGINYFHLGNAAAAEKELRQALNLGIAKEAIILPLAEVLQQQGKNQQIVDEIDALKTLGASEQASLITFRGDAWLSLGKQDNAKREFQRSLEIDPNSALARLGLARLSAANKDIEQALRSLNDALLISSKNAKIWSFQGDLYKSQGENRKAEESYGKALQIDKRNYMDRAKRAMVRIELKDLEAAEEDIKVLTEQAPTYFLTHYAKGLLAFHQRKFAEAQTAFEETVKLNDRYFPTYYFLGVANLVQGQLSQAEDHLFRHLSGLPNSIAARTFLALAKYQKKDPQGARRTLLPVFTEGLPNHSLPLRLMASIEITLGNSKQGLFYLQKLTELDPKLAISHANLGLGKLLGGDSASGISELEAALRLDPKLQRAEELIVLSHIKAKEFEKARAFIDPIIEKRPDDPNAYNLLGVLYAAQEDNDKAVETFEQAVRLSPGTLRASVNLAQFHVSEKQYDRARKLYERILEKHPNRLGPQLRLAELDEKQGLVVAMKQRLKAAIENHPDALQPRLMLGDYYLRFGQPSRAQALLKEVKLRHQSDPRLLYLLADAQLQDDQPNRSLNTAIKLTEAVPNSAHAQFMLSKTYAANRDIDQMRMALERSLEINPKFFPSRSAMVKLLTLEGRTKGAEKLLNDLREEHPNLYETFMLQGWFSLRTAQPEKAVVAYKIALEKYPNTLNAISLAKAQWQAGQKEQSIDTLEAWLKIHSEDALAHYMSASLQTKLGHKNKAVGHFKKLLEVAPTNILALNDLAWLIRKDSPKQALEYAEKAAELSSNSAAVIDTLAMVLIENAKNKRALRLMERSVKKAPKNLTLQYHLAIAQEKNGITSEAVRTLSSILANPQPFDEREEAEALLKQLTKS